LGQLAFHDHLGHYKEPTADYYGIFVENGRVLDRENFSLRTALREIVQDHKPFVRLTAQQNIILTNLDPAAIEDIEARLQAAGVTLPRDLLAARRYSMAWAWCRRRKASWKDCER